jgi:uncharacterized protein (TIGR02996 family)
MFELVEGSSGKFWEVWCEGTAIYTRFGKLGATGQTRLKQEASPAAAMAALDKLVDEKTGDGYVEKGADGAIVTKVIPLDKKELKRHLANLTEDAAYLVLADWLQSQGHPWGELIVLQHGAATAPAEKKRAQLEKAADKLLKQHGGAILGPTAHHADSHLTWRLGFVRKASVATPAEPKQVLAAVKDFVAQPAAQLLESLAVAPVPQTFATKRDWGDSSDNLHRPWPDLDALAGVIPERITALGFGGWPVPAASAYIEMPSFAKLSKAFPKLQRLELTGWAPEKPSKLALSQLTELAVRFNNASASDLEAITSSKLPKLERLTVWLGGSANCVLDSLYSPEDYDEDDEDAERYPPTYPSSDLEKLDTYGIDTDLGADGIGEFLDALPSTVTHLAVQGAALTEEIYARIASHEVMKQLTTLDLSGGNLDDAMSRPLIAAKKGLAHLQRLDVSDNQLTAAGVKKLTAAIPKLQAAHQRTSAGDPFYLRYVAVME